MMSDHKVARVLYKKLLTLYPQVFKERLGESMEQTFNDLFRERSERDRGKTAFIIRTFGETSIGIIREHTISIVQSPMTQPNRAALIAIALFLPFFILNFLAGQDNEVFDRFFRAVFSPSGLRTNPLGYFVIITSILLIPIGSIIALRPIFQKGPNEKRRIYVVNLVLGTALLLIFVFIAGGLLEEIYRCDVLRIPNCD